MIERLLDDHRRILDTADRLGAELDKGDLCNVRHAARLRFELLRDLLAHVAEEDRVFAGMPATPPPPAPPQPFEFGRVLRTHVARWSAEASAGAWEAFRADVNALIAQLRARIEHEERVIYPRLRPSLHAVPRMPAMATLRPAHAAQAERL